MNHPQLNSFSLCHLRPEPEGVSCAPRKADIHPKLFLQAITAGLPLITFMLG
jgi:hypothetical protein